MAESCFEDPAVCSLLAEILEKLPLGFVIGGESFGAYCNAEAARLLQLPSRKLPFSEWRDHVTFRSEHGSSLSLYSPVERALAGAEIRRRRAEIVHSDGSRVQVSVDAFPVGPPDSCVLVLQDLAWEAEDQRARDRWLAAVGHEMRGALHSLATGAAIALHRDVSSEVRRHLDAIAHNTMLLGRLVGDLTTSGLMVDGALEVKPEEIDLRAFIDQAARTAELPGPEHELVNSIPEGTLAFADPDRLQQIVTNLLGNAAKYSSPGTLFVGAELRDADVLIALRDQGPGIAPPDQAQLFTRYARLPSTKHGSGIGLWLCRELARRMGGDVWLRSALGQGTTFFVALPRAQLSRLSEAASG